MQRQVQKAERRISELEAELKTIENKMAEADFYTRPESNEVLKKYSDRKAELDKVYSEWETAVEQLG